MLSINRQNDLAQAIAQKLFNRVMGFSPKTDVSLGEFSPMAYKQYKHAPHLQLIDETLESVSRYIATFGASGVGRVIFTMPPRHGKTQKISRIYPSWHLGNFPEHRVMQVSYGDTLVQKNSGWVRNTIRQAWYKRLFNVDLADDSKSKTSFNLKGHEGGLDALGIGGSATGKGAHLLIIDDPIKNRSQAESLTYRDKIWDAFTDDLYTRLEPSGACVVVMTRWHEDDLVGRLHNSGEEWLEICLPALAKEGDVLGRAVGEALWEKRFSRERLLLTQRLQGDYAFSGLYQQEPAPSEGGRFKRAWFEPIREVPDIVRAVRYWDLAMSDKETADYTVGVKLGEDKTGHVYVLDVVRLQEDWQNVVPTMKRVILADGNKVKQGVEKQGYMSRAVKDLNRDIELKNYQITGHKVDTSKTVRAMPLQSRFAEGVLRVTLAHWTQSYTEEFVLFPNGSHDDQVDATAGAWAMLYPDNEIKPLQAEGMRYA